MEVIIYGILTILICLWGYHRGPKGFATISATTFLGWLYYITIFNTMEFSSQQGWLALGDLAQAYVIVRTLAHTKSARWLIMLVASVFIAMLGAHISLFVMSEPDRIANMGRYLVALNALYLVQLSIVGGVTGHEELRKLASWRDSLNLHPSRVLSRREVRK